MTEINIPNLCEMIHAKNVLDSNGTAKKQATGSQIKSVKSKSKSRLPVMTKYVEKKFEYVVEEDEEMKESLKPTASSTSRAAKTKQPSPELTKKAKTMRSNFVL